MYEMGFIDAPELEDLLTLNELKELIPTLQLKYGKNAVFCFDAGANNVSAYIKPTKKQKGQPC